MQLTLSLADTAPFEFDRVIPLAEGVGGEDLVSVEPVHFFGRVERDQPGYLLVGTLVARCQLRCVRCLEVFPLTFEEQFRLLLWPLSLAPQDEELQLSRKELDVRFFAEPVLDLGELASEQLELLLPMKPLCRENCQGLCPRCGANRNLVSCSCAQEGDERWQSLAELISHRRD